MAIEVDLIKPADLLNLNRAAQMIRKLNNDLVYIDLGIRTEIMGAATPMLLERAFTDYDD